MEARLGVAAGSVAPHGSLHRAGVRLAFSSDLPVVEDPNPWPAIDAVVADGSERLSLFSALTAYMAGGAYASFEERVKGTLEVGRLADFQVYAGDPLQGPRTKRNRPALVALGGLPVYRRGF
jgi:predicted amidohydrolase YtcJ